MHSVEIVLTMLLLVLASGYLARVLPFALPLPLVQIALGAGVAAVSQRGVELDPDIFFLLFLPPLLFLDGWRIPKEGLFSDARPILQLALGLVVFTVVGIGFLIHWLIPAVPLAVAFALAAIVSPTDPVAVASIAAGTPIPRRLMHILEGESLLNDASGLVCFRLAVVAASTGVFAFGPAALNFVWLAAGGLAIGVAASAAISFAHIRITRAVGQEAGAPILVSLLTPFGAYLLAEHIGTSGILAAVAAGITMSYVELSGVALASTRVQRAAVWDMVQFSLNGIVFVLLGEQLPAIFDRAAASAWQSGHVNPWWLAVYALAINVGLALLRFTSVWASLRGAAFVARKHGAEVAARPSLRLLVATSLAGVRGAVTLAGVLTLPFTLPDGAPFPARDLVIFLATAVIVLSLVVASLGLPRLLVGLEVPAETEGARAEDEARFAAAKAAVAAIEHARHVVGGTPDEEELRASAALRVLTLYRTRIASSGANGIEAQSLRRADTIERQLRLVGLAAEREAIFALARQHRVSDDIARRLVREIDLVESRYR